MRRQGLLSILVLVLLVCSEISFAQKSDSDDRPKRTEPSRDYDAIHYRIELRFDEERKIFWGKNTIRLTPFKDGFRRCVLDAETFQVTSVVNDRTEPLEFEQTEHKLVVRLSRSYNHGETITFTVSYDTENSDHERRSQRRRRGNQGGLTFSEETPDNPRVISALSFSRGARHWFPCFDHPNDRVTTEVIATVPGTYSALSNGRLVKITEDRDRKTRTFQWSQEKPHPTYLTVLVAGPYHIIKDSLGDLPINYWVHEKDVGDAMRSFEKTPRIIEFFSKVYGVKYPWAKYDQITIPEFSGGAECTSATILTQSTLHDARAEQDFSSMGLVAHEAAHQWWGDMVTLRDWGHVWINEGMGTYGEYLYSRHELGDVEGAVNLLRKKETYLATARSRGMRPIVDHRWKHPNDNFDAHAYQKAAAVIHMMRFVLGERPFFRTLEHFLKKHAFEPVDTHDFIRAVKEATGQNLEWFFEQWFFSPGHPVFDVSYRWDEESSKVRLRIAQTQDTSGGVPVFRMPVVVSVITAAGKKSRKLWLQKRVEEFELDSSGPPSMVRFDEGNYLLKEWTFEKTADELLYQLRQDDVIGRLWAASELKRFTDNEQVAARLRESAREDPFWAVRAGAVQALRGHPEGAPFDLLRRIAASDPNSRVRTAALAGLGDLREPTLVKFLEERFARDDSYVAQAQALEVIGKCGTESSLKILERALQIRSPRNVIANAARRAQKELTK